jgi:DNA-binding NtrC family response regulator
MKQVTIIPKDASNEKKWCAQAIVACTDFEIEEILVSVLRGFGIHPIVSDSLEEIGALLAEEETVMAFSQTNLPDGSFQKVLSAAEIRASKVPVILCSELYDEDLYIDVMSMGAFEYLAFPCDREEVEWVVNNAIKWGPLLGGTQGHRAGLVSLHGAS